MVDNCGRVSSVRIGPTSHQRGDPGLVFGSMKQHQIDLSIQSSSTTRLRFGEHILRCSSIIHWVRTLIGERDASPITNEDLTNSATGDFSRVEKSVQQARWNGTQARSGGEQSISEDLRLEEKSDEKKGALSARHPTDRSWKGNEGFSTLVERSIHRGMDRSYLNQGESRVYMSYRCESRRG